jgi:hypothetical protein
MENVCENCGKNKDEKYGSGRFCSSFCSKSFSTKGKRKEINEKISKANKGRGVGDVLLNCGYCGIDFYRDYRRRRQKFCSISCASSHVNMDEERKNKIRRSRINFLKSGKYKGYGNKSIYKFKGNDIRCDSHVERACVNYFETLGATDIERSDLEIKYGYNGSISIYIPDFKVTMNDFVFIVEAKSYMSVKKINSKWREYNEKSELKKEALIKYCEENGYEHFWFTKDLNLKYYRSLIKNKKNPR